MEPENLYQIQATPDNYPVAQLLEAAQFTSVLDGYDTILIKPNLVETLQPPVTTPAALIRELVIYLKTISTAEIIIGEGTGATAYDTFHAFDVLEYTTMAQSLGIQLLDLNEEPLIALRDERCERWPEMFLPEIALNSFLLSVPVLKAHSLAGVTLTMKNMMGLAPPAHFQQGGGWKKSAFHLKIQDAVADLNRYRTPDFTLLDATIGMAQAHLWGPTCDPPPQLLIAGRDPVAVDAYGAQLLTRHWSDIGHIKKVHQELGVAEPLHVMNAG